MDLTGASRESGAVRYGLEPDLSPADFTDVLRRSTLAQRRPVADAQRIAGMLRQADLIVTARIEGLLVGVSRALSDFHFCTYLSDLAVDVAHQGRGIGRALIARTHLEAGLQTTLILVAAPNARTYYPHVGLQRHDSCWIITASEPNADDDVQGRPG